jgi:decaprenyl-phosphate phosphoribosyltransferase
LNEASGNSQPGPRAGALSALVAAARPRQWVKNAFVVAPILFSGRFVAWPAWVQCLAATASFCLLSSSIYLVNDICDRNADRLHPEKRRRPVASGRVSVSSAVTEAVVLALAGGAIVAAVVTLGRSAVVAALAYRMPQPLGGAGLAVWAGGYVALNLLYSFWLKKRAIIDVLVVAMGFVMRAMAGAAAIAVPISPWLVVCTFTLCLFIAVAKRRAETVEVPLWQAHAARQSHAGYPLETIEHMLTVSASLAIITYSLYCVAPRTVTVVGSAHMIWTIPLVIYGTFRYYRRCHQPGGADIARALTADRIMWVVMVAYVLLVALIFTYGRSPAVRAILDVTG